MIGWGILVGCTFTSQELEFNVMIHILWNLFTYPIGISFILKSIWVFFCGWREEKNCKFKNLNDE